MSNKRRNAIIFNSSSDEMLLITLNLVRTELCDDIEVKNIKSYLDILNALHAFFIRRPNYVVANYDGSIGIGKYVFIGVLFLVIQWITQTKEYYVAWSKKLRPFDFSFPFAPIDFIRNIPKIFFVYLRCFVHETPNHCVTKGFNRSFAPIGLWYESVGLRLLRYGSWGYSFLGNFGYSNREAFYNHWSTYGFLYNRLGFRKYSVLSWFLFIAMAIVLAGQNGGVLYAIPVVLVLPFSPYCIRSFLTFAKPENLGWSIALAALWCQQQSYIILLSIIVFLLSYVSFTVLFFLLPVLIVLLVASDRYEMLAFLVPVILKVVIDLIPVFRSGWHIKLLKIISGIGDINDNRSTLHRKITSGIFKWPNYVLLLLLLLLLASFSALSVETVWWVPFLFGVYLLFNFQVTRFADEHSFYRAYMVAVIYCYSMQPSLSSAVFCLAFLMIHSSWSDDQHFNKCGQPFPADVPVNWTHNMELACNNFFKRCEPNSRILFEYTGDLPNSFLRKTLNVLERKAIEYNCDLLPNEFTGYLTPQWLFDNSRILKQGQDVSHIIRMLHNAGLQYCAVYSEGLLDALLNHEFKIIGKLPFNILAEFVSDDFSLKDLSTLYLLKAPVCCPVISFSDSRPCSYEILPNVISIHGARKVGEELIVRYTYHFLWKAHQAGINLPVRKKMVDGLTFMEVISCGEGEIIFKYADFCKMIR